MIKNLLFLLILIFATSCSHNLENNEIITNKIDSINFQIKKAGDKTLTVEIRNEYLTKAYENSKLLTNDSIKILYYMRIAYNNLILGNIENYRTVSKKSFLLSKKIKDTLKQAESLSYLGYYYQTMSKYDSAFIHHNEALKLFSSLNNEYYIGHTLLSLATIQSEVHDYVGSEISAVKAIPFIKSNMMMYRVRHHLGVNYSRMGDFDAAIKYHKKAFENLEKEKKETYAKIISLNNIGIAYRNNKQYNIALEYFNQALKKTLLDYGGNAENKAMLWDNIAYTKFIQENAENSLELFQKAYAIRDSMNDIPGIIINSLHLSEYYLSQNNQKKASQHALRAEKLSKQLKINENLLASYVLLSEILPAENGKKYLNKHIKLSDSLLKNERAIREKFTRISYETDEIIKEKNEEIKKKWYILSFSALGSIISLLFFFNLKQRSRNKELLFKQKQEQSNKKVYDLMLSQKTKYEEGSDNEKKRISRELHDGILGRIFGTRLSLESLNNDKSTSSIKEREKYINELQYIESDIRKVSHSLNENLFMQNADFISLIEDLLKEQSKIGKFIYHYNFNSLKEINNFTTAIKIQCYRVIQEAVFNVIKYAKATEVSLLFQKKNDALYMRIEDNGIGFDTNKKNKGIGLNNIRSRIKSLNGTVIFNSEIDRGTQIKITIPL